MTEEFNIIPDPQTFNILVKGCVKNKDLSGAVEYFKIMKDSGVKPNRIIYNSLLDMSVKLENMKQALVFIEQMEQDDISPDGFTYSIILHGLKIN